MDRFDLQFDQRGETLSATSNSATWVVRPDPDLADLIPSFMQNRKNELAELQVAQARGDFEFVRRMSHTWKGICRPYGFVHLETLSKSLEEAGERESAVDVAQILDAVSVYLTHVRIIYEG